MWRFNANVFHWDNYRFGVWSAVQLMCLLGYISICLSRRSMCEKKEIKKKKIMSRERETSTSVCACLSECHDSSCFLLCISFSVCNLTLMFPKCLINLVLYHCYLWCFVFSWSVTVSYITRELILAYYFFEISRLSFLALFG